MDDFVSRYGTKRTRFRYEGTELDFELSHALFSSHDVDTGTRMLLAAMARDGVARRASSALDSGCGVGPIGIALGAANPDLRVAFRDRDTLACAFARANLERNASAARAAWNGGKPDVAPGLLLRDLGGRRFDLVVSNLPAKAGNPVLRDFFRRAPGFLAPGGEVWVVIVNPLAQLAREAILEAGHAIRLEERGAGHAVFAFGPSPGRAPETRGGAAETREPLRLQDDEGAPPDSADESGRPAGAKARLPEDEIYVRSRVSPEARGVTWTLDGLYGLPDFDTLGHAHALAAEMVDRASTGRLLRSVAIANPGAGHSAVYAAKRLACARIDVVARDMLQWIATARALAANGGPSPAWIDPCEPRTPALPVYDLLLDFVEPVPECDWMAEAWERAADTVKPGGAFVVVSGPAESDRLAKRKPKGFFRNVTRRHRSASATLWIRE